MVVITHSVLVARWRPGGLDAADDALVGKGRKGVVHRLKRDGTDVGPYDRVDVGRGAVRSVRHRPQDSQTLCSDLHTVLVKDGGFVNRCPYRCGRILAATLEGIQYRADAGPQIRSSQGFAHLARGRALRCPCARPVQTRRRVRQLSCFTVTRTRHPFGRQRLACADSKSYAVDFRPLRPPAMERFRQPDHVTRCA